MPSGVFRCNSSYRNLLILEPRQLLKFIILRNLTVYHRYLAQGNIPIIITVLIFSDRKLGKLWN